jgi:hypothetical protein
MYKEIEAIEIKLVLTKKEFLEVKQMTVDGFGDRDYENGSSMQKATTNFRNKMKFAVSHRNNS